MKTFLLLLLLPLAAFAGESTPMMSFSYNGTRLIDARVTYVSLTEVTVEGKDGTRVYVPTLEALKDFQLKSRIKPELERLVAEAEKDEAEGPEAVVTVVQVLENGILVNGSVSQNGDMRRQPDVFFIECATDGIVDGQRFRLRVKEAGTFKYTTVMGAAKTIRRFVASTPAAEQPALSTQPASRTQSIGGGQ